MELQQYKAEDFILNDSFVRYCLRSNDTDVQFWENWLQRYPHKQAEVDKAREWVFILGLRLTPEEKEVEFQSLRQRISAITPATEEPPAATPVIHLRSRWKTIFRISAAAILILVAATWLRKATSPGSKGTGTADYALFEAGDSIRKTIVLADGSRVILNTHSKLKVPAAYNVTERQLFLEGEAYFEVAGTAAKPFIVTANQLAIKALGTSFKVRAYTFDTATCVALVNGRVRVSDMVQETNVTELEPGQQLSGSPRHHTFARTTFDINRELNWRSGKLIFEDASLTDIAATLEYWYGIKVHLTPGKYKPIRFNGIFVNKSVNEVLSAICFVNGLYVREKDQALYIQAHP